MGSQFLTRNYKPHGLVHITARGANRRVVFADDVDCATFLSQLRATLYRCDVKTRPRLLAFALKPNHAHLLFQHGRDPQAVPRLMRALSVKYAQYFNYRHRDSGPVWTKPYRGRVVRGGEDLINVVTYIHLNPEASARDRHCSHPIYLGERPAGIISTDLVLRTFGGRDEYRDFFVSTNNMRTARSAAQSRINQ